MMRPRPRPYYPRRPGSPFELSPLHVVLLLLLAAASATLAFHGGRSMGTSANGATSSSLTGNPASAARRLAVSQRLRAAAGIPDLDLPEPEPVPTTPTTTDTLPAAPAAPSPAPSAPSPQPTPTPTPKRTPAPSAPSGGSFDDSG
jgi:hypothetical protein